MSAWETIKNEVANVISAATDTDMTADDLVKSQKEEWGDLAFPCFQLAKKMKTPPGEIALALAGKITSRLHGGVIQSVSAAGPYLNIALDAGEAAARVIPEIESTGADVGPSDSAHGREIMLEYAQPNTHKEIHVGHLRNLVIGLSLHRLLTAAGWNVVTSSYHGDVGAHVAKCLWLLREEGGLDAIPESYRTGKTLGDLYARASGMLDDRPELKAQVSDIQRRLESGDPELVRMWEETRSWSVRDMDDIFEELGVEIERRYFESEVVSAGHAVVDELLERGIAKESDGAVIVDLEDVGLGVFVVRKSDGTSLYATKDLALAKLKFKEYPGLERSLHVVDTRQSFYFTQLFEVFRRMGFDQPMEFIGYDFVTLTTGAMSSRKGNVMTYRDFRDEALAHVLRETVARHADWDDDRVQKTAHTILLAGMKFGMLKQSRDKSYTFDPHKELAFEGETGPYVQYAATRLSSILEKAPADAARDADLRLLDHPAEKRLAIRLAEFSDIVRDSADNLEPSILAQWCVGLSHDVNAFYRDIRVLNASNAERDAKLRLVAAAHRVLLSGLYLLGIPAPKEM